MIILKRTLKIFHKKYFHSDHDFISKPKELKFRNYLKTKYNYAVK